jgi:hypothetical protein
MPALFEQVQFHRLARLLPRIDKAEIAIGEQPVVGSQRQEQGRRIGGYGARAHRSVDHCREVGTGRGILAQQHLERGHGARREADHADASWTQSPAAGVLAEQLHGPAAIVHRQRMDLDPPAGGDSILPLADECFFGCRRFDEAVFQDEGAHAPLREPVGDFVAFVVHGEQAEGAARCDDDGRAVGLARCRQYRNQYRHGDVACPAPVRELRPLFGLGFGLGSAGGTRSDAGIQVERRAPREPRSEYRPARPAATPAPARRRGRMPRQARRGSGWHQAGSV